MQPPKSRPITRLQLVPSHDQATGQPGAVQPMPTNAMSGRFMCRVLTIVSYQLSDLGMPLSSTLFRSTTPGGVADFARMISLRQDPDQDILRHCVRVFFHENRSNIDEAAYQSFFTQYPQEISEYRGVLKAPTHPSHSCSHRDLQRVFRQLEANATCTKHVLIQKLSAEYRNFNNEQLNDLVDLACRTGFLLNARAANSEIETPEPALNLGRRYRPG